MSPLFRLPSQLSGRLAAFRDDAADRPRLRRLVSRRNLRWALPFGAVYLVLVIVLSSRDTGADPEHLSGASLTTAAPTSTSSPRSTPAPTVVPTPPPAPPPTPEPPPPPPPPPPPEPEL